MIPASWPPLAAGAHFTQPRNHSIADPCMVMNSLRGGHATYQLPTFFKHPCISSIIVSFEHFRAWRASLTAWTAVLGFVIVTELVNSCIRRLKHGPVKGLGVFLLDGGYLCDVTSISLGWDLIALLSCKAFFPLQLLFMNL